MQDNLFLLLNTESDINETGQFIKIVDSKYIKFVQSELMNDDVKKEYIINIPNLNNITKVVINTMSQNDNVIEITDKEDIKNTVKFLNNYNILYLI